MHQWSIIGNFDQEPKNCICSVNWIEAIVNFTLLIDDDISKQKVEISFKLPYRAWQSIKLAFTAEDGDDE